jgi:phage shock protein B
MMEDILVPVGIVGMLFIGLPWLILHYSTQWKRAGSISREDEDLLDELYDAARRLDERMNTIERIMTADNPDLRLGHHRQESTIPHEDIALKDEIERAKRS